VEGWHAVCLIATGVTLIHWLRCNQLEELCVDLHQLVVSYHGSTVGYSMCKWLALTHVVLLAASHLFAV
jgi:hypothetical protein